MKKLIGLVLSVLVLLLLLSLPISALAGSTTINYGGTNGTVSINTSTPGYSDNFSMNAGGDFSGYHNVSPYSLSREAEFSGGGDIYAATYTSDFTAGIAIQGDTGYLGQNVHIGSLSTDFLAQASGTYEIDSYVGNSSLGIGMNLQGSGEGELKGDISVYNPSICADVYALGIGNGTFRLYAFAPYLDFGAEIWADSLYTDIYMRAYDAWLDSYTTFNSYLSGIGHLG